MWEFEASRILSDERLTERPRLNRDLALRELFVVGLTSIRINDLVDGTEPRLFGITSGNRRRV